MLSIAGSAIHGEGHPGLLLPCRVTRLVSFGSRLA
jgi:hypothetical protein